MKHCPTCNRAETDDSLAFCRTDGTPLLSDAALAAANLGTIRLTNPQDVESMPTRVLGSNTSGGLGSSTANQGTSDSAVTTLLPNSQISVGTGPVGKRRSRRAILITTAVVAFCTLSASLLYYFYRSGSRSTAPIESIAVMPFINSSGNTEVEYLSDGMTETLINNLSQVPNVSVKARSSVFRYKGKEVEPETVGNELGVQAILNGRVLQHGDELTLYLSLVDTRTGNQLWGEQYIRKQADLLSLQSEIGRDVSGKLRTELSGAEEQKVIKSYPQNAEAYQLYLHGRFFWNKRTPESIQKAIEYFQLAIEKDPTYALGYAGLSDGYTLLAYYGGATGPEALPKAKDAALRAVALDDTLAESHTSLGFVSVLYDYDYVTAEREYKRAIELNPNYALAHQNLGVMLNRVGRDEEGMAMLRRALELEPFSAVLNRLYGDILFCNRRYDEALAQLKKTLELDPAFSTAYLSLSGVYLVTRKYSESVESFVKYQELSGRRELAELARERFAAGAWPGFLRAMTGLEQSDGLSPFLAATFHTQLGQKDEAFARLDQSLENREHLLLYISVDPRLDALRDDLRFEDLVLRMRFPAAAGL